MVEEKTALLQAVYGLRRAAEAEFQGNRYYLAANEVNGLIELLDGEGSFPPFTPESGSFASLLASVRKGVTASLSGNTYYLAAQRLAALEAFLAPVGAAVKPEAVPAPRVEQPSSPKSAFEGIAATAATAKVEDVSAPKPAFSELAAASKARVEEVAASHGLAPSSHAVAPVPAEAPETLADGELERRSSEPCAMAELAPPALEPVAAAAFSAEVSTAPHSARPAADLGSPAPAAKPVANQGPSPATAKEAESSSAVLPSTPVDDRPAIAAGQKIEVHTTGEPKPQDPKTLFKLWLDLLFGRKD